MLFASVLFHVVLLAINQSWFVRPQAPPPAPPIEITDVPQEWQQPPKVKGPKVEQKIVESEKLDNNKLDPNAHLLSERNQVAEKETRAKMVDDFRKKMGSGAAHGAMNETPRTGDNSQAKETLDKVTIGEEQTVSDKKGGVKRNWKSLSLKDLGIGGDGSPTAATDDKIEGVALGDQTVLSTREFRYYSYYNRIKELLRQYWKPNVERKLAMIWARGKQLEDNELTTKLLVFLDDKGNIKKIAKLSGSGFQDLDEAATEAFQKAAPFPNPPKGIVDPDGFVRVRWDFILQTVAGPRIQFHPAGVQ